MIRMFIRHPVEAYDAWRKVYDDFAPAQNRLGVRDQAVFRNVEDGDDITVVHDFETLNDARAFAGSAEVEEAMGNAGVAGPPEIWLTESD